MAHWVDFSTGYSSNTHYHKQNNSPQYCAIVTVFKVFRSKIKKTNSRIEGQKVWVL